MWFTWDDGLSFGVGGDEFVYLDLGQITEDTGPVA